MVPLGDSVEYPGGLERIGARLPGAARSRRRRRYRHRRDRRDQHPRPARAHRRRDRGGGRPRARLPGRRAIEPVSPRRRSDAPVSRRRARRWRSAAFTSPVVWRCCPSCPTTSKRRRRSACRCSPARRRAGSRRFCVDAFAGRCGRSTISWTICPALERRAAAAAAGRERRAHRRRRHELRRRARLPVPVFVLHDHQRAGTQVALSARPTTSRRSSAPISPRASTASSSPTTISPATRTGRRSSIG